MAINTLYPPIVDTYMPAFKVNEAGEGICRIYFAISKYNELATAAEVPGTNDAKIRSIWVSVVNQFTNFSVVDDTIDGYASGLIYFPYSNIQIDEGKAGDHKYYIEVNSALLKDKKWERGQSYKIQLRFCSKSIIENTMSWPVNNSSSFSEWSTITLVQGVIEPTIQLNGLEANIETVLGTTDNTIIGSFNFNSLDNDFLNYYNFKLYKQFDLDTVLYDSGTVYTSSFAPNEINYNMEYGLEDGVRYTLRMEYMTDKLYHATHEYNFMVLDTSGGYIDAVITATPEDYLGRMKISVKSETELGLGNFTIRRASAKTNFTIWEDVQNLTISDGKYLDFNWYDYTIESGIWYKYCIQKRNRFGYRGIALMIEEPVMAFFDDMFLVGKNGRQLRIKFNPQVNSYNHTILESSTQTIGSKYPFITRNGNVNYREFSIGGLISHFMDEEQLFVSHDALYYDATDLYLKYNEKNRINLYNDFTLEREFRKEVQKFLLDGEVKLFKSATEGNILVRLTNIGFTPEATLGRMVYSFQANAVEIDDCIIKNFDKYNIQAIGSYETVFSNKIEKIATFKLEDTTSLNNAITEEDIYSSEKTVRTNLRINDIEVQFEGPPYLINVDNMTNIKGDRDLSNASNIVLGYILKLDGESILVGTHGYYAIEGGNFTNVNVVLPSNVSATIKAKYTILEEENLSNLSKYVNYYYVLGQEDNLYEPDEDILSTYIYPKYEAKNEKQYQKLYSLDSLAIEANPNTVCYIKHSVGNKHHRMLIGDTGYLKLGDDIDSYITNLFITGIHLAEKEKGENKFYYPRETYDNEFELCDDVAKPGATRPYFEDSDDLEEYLAAGNYAEDYLVPRKNGVYRVYNIENILSKTYSSNTNDYLENLHQWTNPEGDLYRIIYYKNNWHIFTPENDVLKSSPAILTYMGELERGELA